MTALRPFGPSVAFTALASILIPLSMRCRASSLNLTSFAVIVVILELFEFNHGHDVFLPHDHEVLSLDPHLGSTVFAEEDLVANLEIAGTYMSIFKNLTLADRHYLSAIGLFGCRIGNRNAAGRGTILFQALHHDTVMERTNLHSSAPLAVAAIVRQGLISSSAAARLWLKAQRCCSDRQSAHTQLSSRFPCICDERREIDGSDRLQKMALKAGHPSELAAGVFAAGGQRNQSQVTALGALAQYAGHIIYAHIQQAEFQQHHGGLKGGRNGQRGMAGVGNARRRMARCAQHELQ